MNIEIKIVGVLIILIMIAPMVSAGDGYFTPGPGDIGPMETDTPDNDLYPDELPFWMYGFDSDGDGLIDNYELEAEYPAKFQNVMQSPVIYNDADDPLYVSNWDETHRIPRKNIKEGLFIVSGRVNLYEIGFSSDDFLSENIWYLTDGASKNYAYVMSTPVLSAKNPILDFTFMGEYKYESIETRGMSSPYDPDTDNDGYRDGDEVWVYHTNPIDSDTDNDMVRDNYDMDPMVDLKITVKISEILEQESPDGDGNFGDYYAKITVDGVTWQSSHGNAGNGHTYPNIKASFNVPDNNQYVDIKIQIWDYDPSTADEHMDIARNGRDVNVRYWLTDARWIGSDDSYFDTYRHGNQADKNGYGHSSGLEDGEIGRDECDIWFDIYQNDADGDRLTYWQEMNVLDTDPSIKDNDSDADGIPDWWEVRYGFDPNDQNDMYLDLDRDRLANVEEYQHGTDPRFFEPNIIVSLNWDADADEIDDLSKKFEKASDLLWDVTDGYMYFRLVRIYNNNAQWNRAHVQVFEGSGRSSAIVGGYMRRTGSIYFFQNDNENALVHEWGHYGLNCFDEYYGHDSGNDKYPSESNWDGVHYWAECTHSIMDDHDDNSELCTENNHDGDRDTDQEYHRGYSSWESFFNEHIDRIWFDLDNDNVRDTSFYLGYNAKSGPHMLVSGGYTMIEVHDP